MSLFSKLKRRNVLPVVIAYLYAGRYEELAAFIDELSWRWWRPGLPSCCLTNPPWPEMAYTFALFNTGRTGGTGN